MRSVLQVVGDTTGLIAKLLYGSVMRLQECTRLRVKDIDFGNHCMIVRSAKSAHDRITLLPETLIEPLQFQLKITQLIHQKDLKEGNGETILPFALSKKYPHAGKEWVWQYVFPATQRSTDPESGVVRRHHLHPSAVQKAVRRATQKAELDKRVSPHTCSKLAIIFAQFRNSSATKMFRPL